MPQAANTGLAVEYETTIFTLDKDEIGPNRATLLHARSEKNNGSFYRALLYIHGYSDYYFHDHLCVKLLEQGYDFFALDLRKCGRSIISPEHDRYRYYFTDIHEYDEEITLAIEYIIKQAKNRSKRLVLYGHSTGKKGGLVVSSYASSGPSKHELDAVILNSPFLSPLETTWLEAVLSYVLTSFGLSVNVPDNWYGQSLHAAHKGEWDFDQKIKTIDKIYTHGTVLTAISMAQKDLMKNNSCIKCPLLLLCSNRSIKPDKKWRDEYRETDVLLNVTTMRRAAATLSSSVTIHEIENAVHDVFLSKLPIREKAFQLMFQWLDTIERNCVMSS